MYEASLMEAEGTLDAIAAAVAAGDGLAAWCRGHDVSYVRIRSWIEAEPARSQVLAQASAARAEMQASAIDAIGRRLLKPDSATGHEWVDSEPNEHGQRASLDAKAARVALEAFKTSATWNDPKRFGKAIEHKHTLTVQGEHLAALRLMGKGGKPQASALPVIDVEHRIVPTVSPVRPVPAKPESRSVPTAAEPESSPSVMHGVGDGERANRVITAPLASVRDGVQCYNVTTMRRSLLFPFTRPQ